MATIDLNKAECLRESTFFGYTRLTNVCSGAVTDVPWGTMDYALAIGLCTFGTLFALMFGVMVYAMITGRF